MQCVSQDTHFGLHWPALPSAINLTSSSKWERTVLMGSLSMPFSASLLSTVLMTLTLFMEGNSIVTSLTVFAALTLLR